MLMSIRPRPSDVLGVICHGVSQVYGGSLALQGIQLVGGNGTGQSSLGGALAVFDGLAEIINSTIANSTAIGDNSRGGGVAETVR